MTEKLKTDKDWYDYLSLQAKVYVAFQLHSDTDRSMEHVMYRISEMYRSDTIYCGYINAISTLYTQINCNEEIK